MLSTLIKKGGLSQVATVTHATNATEIFKGTVTVADVAKVAVITSQVTSMTSREEIILREWLTHIEEDDPEIISQVINSCRDNDQTKMYWLERAKQILIE